MSVWIVTDGNDQICGVFAQGVDIAECIKLSTFKIKDIRVDEVVAPDVHTRVYHIQGTYPEGGPYKEIIRARLWPVYHDPTHL